MHELTTCVAVKPNGRDCTALAVEDCPVPICAAHLRMAFHFYCDKLELAREILKEERQDAARLPSRYDYPTRSAKASVVYYVLIGHHIKIGTTCDMAARMNDLQPDSILATEPGGLDLERRRHAQFAVHCSKAREYFNPAPELLAHIADLRENPPPIPDAFLAPTPGHIAGMPCPSCDLKLLYRPQAYGDATCAECGHVIAAADLGVAS